MHTRPFLISLAVVLQAAAAWGAGAGTAGLILDESCSWRRYYRFATDHVSAEALKSDGAKVLGQAALDRLKKETEKGLNRSAPDGFAVLRPSGAVLRAARKGGTTAALGAKVDPAAADWREFVFQRMFFDPYTAPPPPEDWAAADFDDADWVLDRGTFQADLPNDLPPEKTEGNMAKVHVGALQFIGTGMQAAYYRTRFVVTDPAAADLSLRLVYRGGARVLVNGKEVARGHLPQGQLAPDTPGEDYPLEAYQQEKLRDRALGPVKVPQAALRKGANVIAIEVRASDLHPILLAKPQSRSWNALHDRERIWRHGYLSKLELHGSGGVGGATAGLPSRAEEPKSTVGQADRGTGGVEDAMKRPAGAQVWVADVHHRVESAEFRAPGEGVGVARVVGARNGTYSAQIVVGTDKDLSGIEVTPSGLKLAGGAGEIPADAIRVSFALPIPAAEFSPNKLGDERGLGAAFPTAKELADFAAMGTVGQADRGTNPYVFDQLTSAAPARIPAGTARPVWLSVRIPADAKAGTYKGSGTVAAQGMAAVRVPIEAEVVDWRLPEPKDFKTFVACEENPYAVAKQYGVPLWSKEHRKLLDASFRELGRLGNTWLNVPVLARTEFGNREDSPIKWTRKRDGSLAFDYTVLDQYLNLAVKHWGTPRVIHFAVMHGMGPGWKVDVAAAVNVLDERTGKTAPLAVGGPGVNAAEKRGIWESFAKALHAHMKAKGIEKSVHWGYPLDCEVDHDLVVLLGGILPEVKWVGGPHQIGSGGFPEPKYYDTFGTVRYFANWPGFRMEMGWKAPQAHLAIPRIDSSVLSLHTASHPFAFRVFPSHALALGRAGICRVGADEWAAAHYQGMQVPVWIVGMPVLFTLWPGRDGAESSARHEALLEGIQEGEARIAIEQALDRGRLNAEAARRLRAVLAEHFHQTSFFQNKLCIFELERYHHGWQARSRALYQAAAEAARGQ